MSDLRHAKVDDTDNGDVLLGELDEAQDALVSEIRKGTTYRSTAPGDVYDARKEILDRIYSLCEALQEARGALSDQEDLAEARQAQIDAVEATLTEREETIEQLRAELAEVQRA